MAIIPKEVGSIQERTGNKMSTRTPLMLVVVQHPVERNRWTVFHVYDWNSRWAVVKDYPIAQVFNVGGMRIHCQSNKEYGRATLERVVKRWMSAGIEERVGGLPVNTGEF